MDDYPSIINKIVSLLNDRGSTNPKVSNIILFDELDPPSAVTKKVTNEVPVIAVSMSRDLQNDDILSELEHPD